MNQWSQRKQAEPFPALKQVVKKEIKLEPHDVNNPILITDDDNCE